MTPEQAIETLRAVAESLDADRMVGSASDIREAASVLADTLAERDAELRESDRMVESAWRQRADETEKAKQAERERDAVVAELGEAQERFREAEAERDKLRAALSTLVRGVDDAIIQARAALGSVAPAKERQR